jgi:uncharacterized membrane protein YraQ (UPF0718 family)
MSITTAILALVALALFVFNARQKGQQVVGLITGLKLLLKNLPIILLALILAGMVEVLIPRDFVQNWLSAEAGIRGVIIGVLGGVMLAMGPYATLPIVSSIYVSGAGVGTVIALISSWSLLGLSKTPHEAAHLGGKYIAYKTILGLILSFLAGCVGLGLEYLGL